MIVTKTLKSFLESFPKMTTFNPVTHVIFDMDGLLINTEDLYTELYTDLCEEFGGTYTYEMKLKIRGVLEETNPWQN